MQKKQSMLLSITHSLNPGFDPAEVDQDECLWVWPGAGDLSITSRNISAGPFNLLLRWSMFGHSYFLGTY